MADLYPSEAPNPTFLAVTTGAARGNRFYAGGSVVQTVTHLAWFRESAAGPAPSELDLWDAISGELLAQVAPTDSGVAGWQLSVAPGVNLRPGHTYCCGAKEPANFRVSTHAPVDSDSPLIFFGGVSGVSGTPPANPTAPNPGLQNGYSVRVEDAAVQPVQPATLAEVESALADWLDHDTSTQPTSEPVRNNAALVDVQARMDANGLDLVGTLQGALTTASGAITTVGALVGDVLTDTAALLGRVPATLGATLTTIKDAVTVGPLPGIVGLETLANNILAALEAAAQYLANPLGGSIGALRNTPAVPGSGWTLIDTVDFTFQKAWDVPADLYVLTSAGYPPNFPLQDVDGAPWRPRAGWWAVRNGDAFLGRQFVDWDVQHLVDGGRRMPGVIVRLQPGVEATLEAWRLT